MQKKNCRAGKVLLALCLLLASPSLAEEETGGLVAFQEEINGMRFHAMVDTTITEAPVIEPQEDSDGGFNAAALLPILLIVVLGAGGAYYFLKVRKRKPDTSGATDLDDYAFPDDDEDEVK